MRFEQYFKEMESVEGWLLPTTAFLSHHLMVHQTEAGLSGNACEIGVHHGKYFIALACGLQVGETAVAIDVFEDQHKNLDPAYTSANRKEFDRQTAKFLPPDATVVIKGSSTELAASDISTHGVVRFFSIDGGHTEVVTLNDLRLAEQTLCKGGIAALDDILNFHWTGVVSGYARYRREGGLLRAFALIPNKLLLTDVDSAPRYASFMRNRFPMFVDRYGKEMIGDLIDVYGERPPETLETPPQKIERLSRELAAAASTAEVLEKRAIAAEEAGASAAAERDRLRTRLEALTATRWHRIGSSVANMFGAKAETEDPTH